MVRPKRLRNLQGLLRDKISLIKATVLLSKRTTSCHIAVLRVTTHDPSKSPPEHRINAVLSLGHHSIPTASAAVDALLTRLHTTRNAYVVLKCLLTVHNVITRGSSLFKDQISHYPLTGGYNFLNLSTFRDDFDSESWELSAWARWYAGLLEQSLIVSSVLGFYFSSPSSTIDRKKKTFGLSSSSLLEELEALVGMAEQICRAPDSLDYQRISLIYEVMKLAGEDYRMTLREIYNRLTEFGRRIDGLSLDELNELLSELIRLDDCREKLILMFLNKKNNDGFWDLVREMRVNVGAIKERKENMKLARFEGGRREGSESTRVLVASL